MRKLTVFNNITIDGYFTDKKNDMSWAHNQDEEFSTFVQENAKGGGELLFGRVTYEMMASFWPSPQALQMNPVVAKQMNSLPKVVFSRTLNEAQWENTRLLKGDLGAEVRKLKNESGRDMIIFGSGQITSQLTQLGLIDQYQIVLNPLALGQGRTMFEGLSSQLRLLLTKSRIFKNGNIFLCYDKKS